MLINHWPDIFSPSRCYTALKQLIKNLRLKEPSLNSLNITKHISFIFTFHRGEDLHALVAIAMFIDKKVSK